MHRTSRRKTVIDQNSRTVRKIGRGLAAAIKLLSPHHLGLLPDDDFLHFIRGNLQLSEHGFIESPRIAGDGSHGQFRLPGDAELAYHDDVQEASEALSDGESYGNSATGQGEDDCIVSVDFSG